MGVFIYVFVSFSRFLISFFKKQWKIKGHRHSLFSCHIFDDSAVMARLLSFDATQRNLLIGYFEFSFRIHYNQTKVPFVWIHTYNNYLTKIWMNFRNKNSKYQTNEFFYVLCWTFAVQYGCRFIMAVNAEQLALR